MAELGFVGLGSQGAPIAARMLADHPLTIWARRPEAAAALAGKGARVAASLAQLGAICDHVGICVVNDADVIEVCDQLLPAMRSGSVLAIHSTILPQTCEALAVRAADQGVLLLDAPVSGGAPAAEAGTLTVMCGGSEAAFAKALPVLQTFGSKIMLLGPAGAGQRAKIINNALLAANMGLAHAALDIAASLDVDRAAIADLIRHSSGRSFGFDVYARLPEPSAFAHGGALLFKDVNLLGAIADHDNALATAAMPFLDAAGVTKEAP
ncbi:NAD(P)-dependent oxidoreductase [Novosphingobium guangzhouense]|uniref:6-phosphogluconate dehydrogenase n=1 Tax=Novosphingobium guangzhouense TaxID=1850347 RepID=A0A2K2G5G8_9SPHN|nr:NAD(P)-dependent oxidoreductase [Novosphingobium guangzhouense]PNU06281.1 6-phosphogluconate dehydrogenase [Novosphingobium guangzhouense]